MADTETGWSKEPRGDGVYWWRIDEKDNEPDIHEVQGEFFYQIGFGSSEIVKGYGGEWLGPISPSDFEQLLRLRQVMERALACLTMSRKGFTEWQEADDIIDDLHSVLAEPQQPQTERTNSK